MTSGPAGVTRVRLTSGPASRCVDEHLRVRLDARGGRAWRECADVLVHHDPSSVESADLLTRGLLRRYPGCLLAVARLAEGGCLALDRSGRRVLANGPELTTAELDGLSSFLHLRVLLGAQSGSGNSSRVRIRSRSRRVSLGLIER